MGVNLGINFGRLEDIYRKKRRITNRDITL